MKKGRNESRQLNNRPNIMMCLALVLFFFVGVSTYYVAGLYARYTATGAGDDGARVASFKVSAVEDTSAGVRDDEYDLSDDPEASFKIDLNNESEVAVRYNIVITLNESLPEGVEVSITDGPTPTLSADKKVYTFSDVGTLAMGGTGSEELKFSGTGTFLENFVSETDLDWMKNQALKIAVEFIQID